MCWSLTWVSVPTETSECWCSYGEKTVLPNAPGICFYWSFKSRLGVVLRELGMGHPSVFLCLLGIFSVGRPSSAVGKPRSWGLSWVWASVASLHGRHCVLALSWVICCENQPYSGILLPCVLSTVLSHLGQVIPGILCFFFHFLTSYLKLLCIFRVFSRGCFGGLDLGFFCALCWKLWLSLI